jgi:hypothetical protein
MTPLFLQDTVSDNVLLFDGLSRAGKGLVGPLVSELPRLEFAQLVHALDYIPTLWHLGLIDDRSAPAFLRMVTDTYTYQRIVGRNLNTRYSDIFTSVYRSLDAKTLLERAFGDEGQEPVDRFNEEGRISCFITHETLPHADLWFRAFPKLRVVLTVRHPVDLCYSWNSRNLGDRLGTDPLAFTPVADIEGKPVPLFALEDPDAYQAAAPFDRIAMCILQMERMYDDVLASLSPEQSSQVKLVAFEHMATEPVRELQRLANWLGTTLHPNMPIAMARENVPRLLDIADRRARLETLSQEVAPDLLEQILDRGQAYESLWGLEPL